MTQRSVKPNFYEDEILDTYRDQFMQTLTENNFKKRDLSNDLDSIRQFSEFYQNHELPFAKKQKKQKIGNLGMDELTKIVLNLKQDVKQIRDAQSVEGAKAWVAKHGPDLYTVHNTDINGDNIPDIVVRNKAGKNVIVNGYTTADSLYPYRHAFYTEFPTADARKAARENDNITYRSFINSMYNPQYDEWGMKLQAENPYANSAGLEFAKRVTKSGYKKTIAPSSRSPYQAYVSQVAKPIYNVIKEINTRLGVKTKSTLLTTVAADVWNQTILIPAMIYVYGPGIGDVSESEWKKLRNRKEVKTAILKYVKYYINNNQALISLVPLFVLTCEKNGNPIDKAVQPWVPRFLMASLLNISPDDIPPTNEEGESAWLEIEQRFNEANPLAPPVEVAVAQDN